MAETVCASTGLLEKLIYIGTFNVGRPLHEMNDASQLERLAVWFLGRTGSGKTSLARLLEAHLDFHVVSGGDLLRRFADNEHGRTALDVRMALQQGRTLPDHFIMELYDAEFKRSNAPKKCLDGNPRNLSHFMAVRTALAKYGFGDAHLLCFHLDINQVTVNHRISLRRVCPSCKRQTTKAFCEACEAKTLRRTDDTNPKVLAEKNRWFDIDVRPVVDRLNREGRLITIDASEEMEKVSEHVLLTVSQRCTLLRQRSSPK